MREHRTGLRFYHTTQSMIDCACGGNCWGEPSLVVILPHRLPSGRGALALYERCIPSFRAALDEEMVKA